MRHPLSRELMAEGVAKPVVASTAYQYRVHGGRVVSTCGLLLNQAVRGVRGPSADSARCTR